MIVDHRTYTLPHGRMQEYLDRYAAEALELQRRHLGCHIGSFVTEIGPLNQVIHMWGFASLAEREARRARMEQDPAWLDFRDRNGGTFVAQETRILRATAFSPQLILPRPLAEERASRDDKAKF